jgi:hypothetical protein
MPSKFFEKCEFPAKLLYVEGGQDHQATVHAERTQSLLIFPSCRFIFLSLPSVMQLRLGEILLRVYHVGCHWDRPNVINPQTYVGMV